MRSLRPIALTICAVAVAITCAHPIAAQRPQPAPLVQPAGDPLDINTATPEQLNALPGFGPAYTRRVIAGRPYRSKNQLVTKGIVPSGVYQRVSALIVAHHPAR